MEFRETLLAAQRNQQQKSSESSYYKAKFDPPKKENRQRDRLSANIQKFLAKKDEEEKQKKLEAERKRDELLAMRDPKLMRKIQKSLKVFKSANKSVIQDAVDHDNTAITRLGADQPDQDDYGYESQEAAAIYEKMMLKYSKIPDEPKFPTATKTVKKDLSGTIERVKHALQHEDDPVPHKRKRKTTDASHADRELTPPAKYEPEKKKDEKPEKPKFRKPAPPPMDFNQLLKLAEQKKSEPIEVGAKKPGGKPEVSSSEPERLMTKKQKREYEEELARRQRRQERIDAEKSSKKIQKEDRPSERERKPEPTGFGRIPKIGDKARADIGRHDNPITKSHDKDKERHDRERNDRERHDRERADKMREKERAREKEALERDKLEREKERIDQERLARLKAERDRIEKEMERLSKDREKLDRTKSKLEAKSVDRSKPVDKPRPISKDPMRQEVKKSIDLKSQNTYRIDKNSNEFKNSREKVPTVNKDSKVNGHSSQGKPVPKQLPLKDKAMLAKKLDGSPKLNGHGRPDNGKRPPERPMLKKPDDRRPQMAGPSKSNQPQISSNFDFDKHVSSFKNKSKQYPPGDVKRKPQSGKAKRRLDSESEYDSEMDDFIDDGDEQMDYSRHIKEIFGYDKSRYRYMDDDDDPNMESNFAQVQREEFISKKHGIMEDLADMRLEAMMKAKQKAKKKRRISED